MENISKNNKPTFLYELEYWEKSLFVAGVDEAGRGPLAGPVVAAAVIFPINSNLVPGVNDSKLISEKKREELFVQIIDKAICVGTGIIDNITIDEINILNATYKAMNLALSNLKLLPEIALIDGNSFKSNGIRYKTIIKGDKLSFSIAAASIIAKVTRDRIMSDEIHKEFPFYCFNKNKGYGTKEHYKAIELYGICKYHRKSFLKRIIEENLLF